MCSYQLVLRACTEDSDHLNQTKLTTKPSMADQTELRHRGVQDVYVSSMDGSKGLPEAVNAMFPKTLSQLGIVHLVRTSLRYVTAKDSKAVVAPLRRIYISATCDEALRELDAFEAGWGGQYKAVVRLWRGNWDNIIPFFQFLPEIRKVIYALKEVPLGDTTNVIEPLNMAMCKYTRNRRIFPNDDSALKSLFLAIGEASRNWKSIHHSKPALQSFQVMFGEVLRTFNHHVDEIVERGTVRVTSTIYRQ